MNQQQIESKIKSQFPDAKVIIQGEDCSLLITVITDQFESLSLLERQRKIMHLFQENIVKGQLHALSLKTHTFKEIKQKKS